MPDDLEQELRGLTPSAPADTLDARIAHRLSKSEFPTQQSKLRINAFADRLLLATLTSGLAASIVVVALLTSDHFNDTFAYAPVGSGTAPTLANAPRLLAQLTNDPSQ